MSLSAAIALVASCVALSMLVAGVAWWARGRWQVTLDRERAAAGAATAEARVGAAERHAADRLERVSDDELAAEFDRRFGGE